MRAVLALALVLTACDDCRKPAAATDGGEADAHASEPPSDGAVVNATPLPTASVQKVLNPDDLPPYSGPTGSVEGTVTVIGDPPIPTPFDFSRCPDAEKMYGQSFRKGPNGELGDAIVVALGRWKGFVPEKNEAKTMHIVGCGFDTRTITMTFGQRLEVQNDTNDFWTPMLEPGNNFVMMMAPPHGDPVKLYPKKAGEWLVLDRDRKYVVADLLVLRQPLHTVTDVKGRFRLDGIPVGPVQLGITHPRMEARTRVDVDVKADTVQRVDVTLVHKHVDGGVGMPEAGPAVTGPR